MRITKIGSVKTSFKKQVGKTCWHFPGLQSSMSDTEELPFLDPAPQKPVVNVKKMENLKKKVKWTVRGMGGHEDRDQGWNTG